MADIDAHGPEMIVEPGEDEQAKIEQTGKDLDEALAQDEAAAE